ncbi:MAG: agmatine deiminase family protein [Saprospiraceae bacterium]|nr:agmatine deiminase family protein [Candidatus Vicinibacter affinis]MBP6173771.1 agmatine deiminase family protein [Saprospiraceae bacterium]MBK7302358.1 agmatine deiminase family protein [Candidatus Vicinibacter affinis]MBK7693482.1 agmatine deiminase family protein [Candidatus Vicinibacter affinis]MBK7798317.1 agmatine deiminase family protein [Candidatus Vicinibacter affinis]
MKKKYLILIVSLILFQFLAISQTKKDINGYNYYTQGNSNRTVAEWEPAKGTMIAWPLGLPYKLIVELAKDNHLYTLVTDDSTRNEAIKWYKKWGIDPTHNTFITMPLGVAACWTRDWGPTAIFAPDGNMKLGNYNSLYAPPHSKLGCPDSVYYTIKEPSELDDKADIPLGKALNIEVLDLPFICTGGNFLTDGLGIAFSTCILPKENKLQNIPESQFFKLSKDLQGINNYHIISNFEKEGIQHIDCFMTLLDEERMLVAEPPADHELYGIYENIVQNELSKLNTIYGRPYEILRLKIDRYDGDKLTAYLNSLIVNKTIYVPLFQIKADSIALQTWQKAMPGYTVKGFEFALKDEPLLANGMNEQYPSGYGWKGYDALHCRTRAIWDNEMLFITTKRIDKIVDSKNRNIVYTTIIDYSKQGLVKDKNLLFWRTLGETNWRIAELNLTENPNHFFYEIPYHKSGSTVEYYISAESKSGRKETQPRAAPLGTYKFTIE